MTPRINLKIESCICYCLKGRNLTEGSEVRVVVSGVGSQARNRCFAHPTTWAIFSLCCCPQRQML